MTIPLGCSSKLPRIGGIYAIVNLRNGRMYLGSSVNIASRLAHHATALRKRKHPNQHLQASWNKYGSDAFTAEVVALAPPDVLLVAEQCLLARLLPTGALYNICLDTTAPMRGRKHTVEWKAAAADRMRGNTINRGRKQSSEDVARRAASNSRSHRGRSLSANHRASLRRGWEKRRLWWKPSEDAKEKWRSDAAKRRDPKTGRIT